mmetsp:Transcript_28342/g.27198  ORF Transcript_28342/g.27198 Transcript_28342/m.27198 type:complete len:203 (+) Transcript_28342:966-1574(+)
MQTQVSLIMPLVCTPSRHSGLSSLSPKLPRSSLTQISAHLSGSCIMDCNIWFRAAYLMSHSTMVTVLVQDVSRACTECKYKMADGFFSTATMVGIILIPPAAAKCTACTACNAARIRGPRPAPTTNIVTPNTVPALLLLLLLLLLLVVLLFRLLVILLLSVVELVVVVVEVVILEEVELDDNLVNWLRLMASLNASSMARLY